MQMWGVFIWDGHHNEVIGNLIGTDALGAADLGNTYSGVSLSIAWENTIGGAIAGGRNIISGNDWRGISVYDSDNNLIEGNYVGTDITGQLCVENGSAGIALSSSSGNTIGGLSENSKNVISCSDFGVRIEGGGHNVILGNSIGTDALGIRALGNSGSGVGIINSAYNTIGGTEDGAANIIAYNGGAGESVWMPAADLENVTSEFGEVVFVMTLAGDILADELALWWTPVPGVAQYWMYGATNDAYFEPGLSSPYENRLAILPSETTAWGTPYGIGDPYSNWTYLVMAGDGSDQEISHTNRFGEFEFSTPIP